MVKISQIKLVEVGDFSFRVDFLLNDRNALSTQNLPKDTPRDAAREEIKRTVETYLTNRADENFMALKVAYEDKTINL